MTNYNIGISKEKQFGEVINISELAKRMKKLHNDAYKIYAPIAEDLCNQKATEKEVEDFFDHLLGFAADERILVLFKKVCRYYITSYPEMVNDYVHFYFEQYEPEKLEKYQME